MTVSGAHARAPAPWAWSALGAALLGVLLFLWRDTGYWNYSEGVYALTARLWLHGSEIYRHVVLAQPPGVAVFGAGALAVHDSLLWLRGVVGAWQVLGAIALGGVVWEVTSSRAAAIATPLVALSLPWTVHEFGQLTPETVATPLLALALLLAVRDGSRSVGLIAGVLVFVKLPLVLPAAALVYVTRDRRAAGVVALATVVVLGAVCFALFGSALWTDLVVAQTQTGEHSLHDIAAYWTQGGWNLIALVVVAAFGLRERLLALVAVATLLTGATTIKLGTALNVLTVVEAMLVPVAMVGALALWRKTSAIRWLPVLAGVVLLAQSLSLVTSPGNPKLFLRPASQDAWKQILSADQVSAAIAQTRRCRAGERYAGPPFLAFVTHRRMPADQPDQFLLAHAATLRAFAVRAAADPGTCP